MKKFFIKKELLNELPENIYWYKHTSLKNKKKIQKIEDLFEVQKALFKALKLFQVSTLLLLQAKILNLK